MDYSGYGMRNDVCYPVNGNLAYNSQSYNNYNYNGYGNQMPMRQRTLIELNNLYNYFNVKRPVYEMCDSCENQIADLNKRLKSEGALVLGLFECKFTVYMYGFFSS